MPLAVYQVVPLRILGCNNLSETSVLVQMLFSKFVQDQRASMIFIRLK